MDCGLHHAPRTTAPSEAALVRIRPRVARRSSNCVVVRSASWPPRTGALSERSIRGGHKSHRPFVEDASSLASDPMRYCAQLCRGESGSHVQVAGASLAGNDHSLSSSTVTGCVAGLFGCSRAGTGSSLCGSVEDRSSMDETIHRSCRASHRERDRRLRHSAAAAPGRDSSTRTDAWPCRVPRSWSHAWNGRKGLPRRALRVSCTPVRRDGWRRNLCGITTGADSSCQREQCACTRS